jgi:menaquinone-dependent protoporphyrinogen oxidase
MKVFDRLMEGSAMMLSNEKERWGMRWKHFLLLLVGIVCFALAPHSIIYASDQQAGPESIESTLKKDGLMKNKVLIVYASRAGSTGEVAKAVGQTLSEAGASVDVRSVTDTNDLSNYEAVIVGSAIRMGRWLPEAVDFVKKHRDTLSRVHTAYFVVCNTMKDDTPENRKKVLAYLDPVRKAAPNIEPVDTGLFAGVVDFSKLSFMDKSMLKVRGASEGDFRNWVAIKKWATDIAPMLLDK